MPAMTKKTYTVERAAMDAINAVEGIPMLTDEENEFLASIKGLPSRERIIRIKAFVRRKDRRDD